MWYMNCGYIIQGDDRIAYRYFSLYNKSLLCFNAASDCGSERKEI